LLHSAGGGYPLWPMWWPASATVRGSGVGQPLSARAAARTLADV
jgi:hypothetical protein